MSNSTKTELNELIYKVNGAAIEVHKVLGPGLLESVYHQCMMLELDLRNIKYESEKVVEVAYKSHKLETKLRCDLFIENELVVELKSVGDVPSIFEAQILTYMNLLKVPAGLLINFNVKNIFYEGQQTYVNEIYRSVED
jgi:GxxExxY protein